MSKQQTISENQNYMSEESLAALEQAPDSAWDAIQAAADTLEASDIGVDCEVATTNETIEDFENSRKAHAGRRIRNLQGYAAFQRRPSAVHRGSGLR